MDDDAAPVEVGTADDPLNAGHRGRLRERFLREGLEGFPDHQVLELLLFYILPRRDTNRLAHQLIRRFGSLSAVLEADPVDLAGIEGIGRNAAVFLTLFPPLTRRYLHDRATRDKPALNQPEVTCRFVVPLMLGRTEEVFYVLCLDSRLRLLFPALISHGTVKKALVHPRQVVEAAIRHKASGIILAHNHPSGSVKPSPEDIEFTKRLQQALTVLDIRLLDHIIVAGTETCSMAKRNLL
ncbi:MAG: DNA repair protein RadC [Magnetococcales bacterium]|nr:DNA repair protein RadC [Magnetococcales bacterium]